MPGPAWLGIGAQRSGTGWLSELVTQHPEVAFGTNDKKEQAYLHRIPDGLPEDAYLDLFPDDGLRRGDWSPHYLPSMVVPHIARRLVRDGAPILVILRDPVERLASGMRRAKRFNLIETDFDERWMARAHQYGQYASCLEGWSTAFPRDRFVVVTYEEAKEDVERVCRLFWSAIGVDPVPLTDPYRLVKKPTEGKVNWRWPDGTREALTRHYLPQVLWLRDHWDVDVTRWENFDGLLG
jgi:hypothetical protein